jgi:hypothetical protein
MVFAASRGDCSLVLHLGSPSMPPFPLRICLCGHRHRRLGRRGPTTEKILLVIVTVLSPPFGPSFFFCIGPFMMRSFSWVPPGQANHPPSPTLFPGFLHFAGAGFHIPPANFRAPRVSLAQRNVQVARAVMHPLLLPWFWLLSPALQPCSLVARAR